MMEQQMKVLPSLLRHHLVLEWVFPRALPSKPVLALPNSPPIPALMANHHLGQQPVHRRDPRRFKQDLVLRNSHHLPRVRRNSDLAAKARQRKNPYSLLGVPRDHHSGPVLLQKVLELAQEYPKDLELVQAQSLNKTVELTVLKLRKDFQAPLQMKSMVVPVVSRASGVLQLLQRIQLHPSLRPVHPRVRHRSGLQVKDHQREDRHFSLALQQGLRLVQVLLLRPLEVVQASRKDSQVKPMDKVVT
mmetsp:Transcript_10887/g.26333  ORF Transcript_10887/g.26333 Transcript_10887/m.26333 type:complete len:246 (+) Transcript_10887:808-1545(+)